MISFSKNCNHEVQSMLRTQIQLTKAQAEALKRIAAARGCSKAELVRRGVDLVIGGNPDLTVEEKRRRAAAVSGKFRSGRKDLSRKHDRHLGEVFER